MIFNIQTQHWGQITQTSTHWHTYTQTDKKSWWINQYSFSHSGSISLQLVTAQAVMYWSVRWTGNEEDYGWLHFGKMVAFSSKWHVTCQRLGSVGTWFHENAAMKNGFKGAKSLWTAYVADLGRKKDCSKNDTQELPCTTIQACCTFMYSEFLYKHSYPALCCVQMCLCVWVQTAVLQPKW